MDTNMSTVIRGNGWNPGIIKEKIYFAVEILEGYRKDNYNFFFKKNQVIQ